jgi:predicted ATPase
MTVRGFKSIQELMAFRPGAITILIGPNGAGKSNLISFFRFLSWALTPPGQLQEHVARLGGASAILHDGPETTRDIEAEFQFVTDAGVNEYGFRLAYAAGDTLIYTDERYRFSRHGSTSPAKWRSLGAGHKETALVRSAESGDQTAQVILGLTRKMVVHQFHNTSETARIRQKWYVDENRWLKEDAGNLAPLLLRLRRDQPQFYQRIVDTVRMAIPFFAEFDLEPEYDRVLLRWRERGSDYAFSASQAADGMLRLLALIALLQQPEADLPDVLILDEPELGLHPYAIEILAGLLRAASKHVQVMVATQSVSLIDRFSPGDIVVVDRRGRQSTFRRLAAEELQDWLSEYTLSELWEKNVIGGRPAR